MTSVSPYHTITPMNDFLTPSSFALWLLAGIILAAVVWVGIQVFAAKALLNHLRMILQESAESSRRLVSQTERDLYVLTNAIRRMRGESVFTPDMKMKDCLAADPRVHRYLAKHRRSGVIRMEIEPERTLRETTDLYDLDIDALLKDLNDLT